jgi:hypothetical protein
MQGFKKDPQRILDSPYTVCSVVSIQQFVPTPTEFRNKRKMVVEESSRSGYFNILSIHVPILWATLSTKHPGNEKGNRKRLLVGNYKIRATYFSDV